VSAAKEKRCKYFYQDDAGAGEFAVVDVAVLVDVEGAPEDGGGVGFAGV